MWQELRYAARSLARRPAFAACVVTTLALGLGANVAIFSVVRAVILRPPPYADPDRLVRIYETSNPHPHFMRGGDTGYIVVRPGTLHQWRTQSRSFERIEEIAWRSKTLSTTDRTESVTTNDVSSGFFAVAGTPAALGRTLIESDFSPGAAPVVVLSDSLWRARFAADTSLVGRTIRIDGAAVPVVGVMPRGFYPDRYRRAELWMPRIPGPGESGDRTSWSFITLARLRPGITLERAQEDIDLISARVSAIYGGSMGGVVVPVTGEIAAPYERLLYFLFGAVGLVLAIACVNVANLLLARSLERRHELSVRAALGAGRHRLVRQVLAECLILSAVGGALGVLIARVALHPILAMIPADRGIPRIEDARLDGAVLLFALVASAVTGFLFGLTPAWRAARMQPMDTLREGGRGGAAGRRERRLGDLVVVVEVALALPLLLGAGLLLRSLALLQHADSGFDEERVIAMQLTPPTNVYGAYEVGGTNAARAALFRDLERAVAALSGVVSASVSASLPLRHGVNPWSISIDGRSAPPDRVRDGTAASNRQGLFHHGSISIERVGAAYFQTLGIPLVRGRYLDAHDDANVPLVTVVSETMAKKFFPGEDPIGKRITVDMTSYFPRMTIVGVVRDNRMHGVDRELYPLLYWSIAQLPSSSAWLVVKARSEGTQLERRVVDEVHRIAPQVPVNGVTTMTAVKSESLWRQRFTAFMIGLFATVALVLAAAGVYGVVGYSVSRRMREMAIRVALGAKSSTILRLIVFGAVAPCVAGTVIGLALFLSTKRVLDGQLFGVPATDPTILIAASALPILVGAIAGFVPARQLLRRLDPSETLRSG